MKINPIGITTPGEIIEAIKHPKDTIKAIKRKSEDLRDTAAALIENSGAREVAIKKIKKGVKRGLEDIEEGAKELIEVVGGAVNKIKEVGEKIIKKDKKK